ncbi:MAG: glycogen operon protein [Candidatus Electronema aureum]|uniref:Glycogen operon protein n=1 Tax=Candidatus Electronema aureum TaxID=2005002 RepID=A0A521G2A4_9BACT|nr:MAG: glycogen operon protein [Candidatus Electronema aureum]
MKIEFSTFQGIPQPLGATFMPSGINFALFSRHARSVSLVLGLKEDFEAARLAIQLDPKLHKTGDIWHVLVSDLPPGIRYGWRISGPYEPETSGLAYDSSLILLDPYAKELRSPRWGQPHSGTGKQTFGLIPDEFYDWEGDRPLNIPLQDSIIYEMHVRGFTVHKSSRCSFPGTFRGLTEKIPYLQALGITAVELMPVTEFDETDCVFHNPETGEQLKNYWGYNPLSFFAPKAAYSSDSSHPLHEFRDTVKALHRAGIEVILDMVFNHTSEGGWNGPTTSFRGIDNPIYYLLDPWTKAYLNFSGCGNTCNCNHPIVRSLIMDALRWWVIEMHVDGFRFDLASILGRDQQGHVLSNPPMVEMIAEDPVLADTKIIAEAWDAAGLYQVGHFSDHHRWAEWNGKFRDDVRRFMNGTPGLSGALATRIAGSSDLYQHNGRRPCNSINFITSHDGFTLADLVSYSEKDNRANGEDNRDGDNHNLSWNSGVEGPTNDPALQRLRLRRVKTMAAILLLSQGVPMLVAGDEFGRTQQGNNNAWCQDNEISWIDWRLAEKNKGLLRFFQKLIRLRRDHAIFRRAEFFEISSTGTPPSSQEILWHGLQPGEPDWSDQSSTLAFLLKDITPDDGTDANFFVMLNGQPEETVFFTVPDTATGTHNGVWKKIIDTNLDAPGDFLDLRQAPRIAVGAAVKLAPMGCVVLQSEEVKPVRRRKKI